MAYVFDKYLLVKNLMERIKLDGKEGHPFDIVLNAQKEGNWVFAYSDTHSVLGQPITWDYEMSGYGRDKEVVLPLRNCIVVDHTDEIKIAIAPSYDVPTAYKFMLVSKKSRKSLQSYIHEKLPELRRAASVVKDSEDMLKRMKLELQELELKDDVQRYIQLQKESKKLNKLIEESSSRREIETEKVLSDLTGL